MQKERRHDYEYETVWIDPVSGEEVEPPEDVVAEPREKRENGKPKPKAEPKRGGRPVRVPPAPSWQRAAKRSLILGAVIFVFFYLAGSKNHSHNLGSALLISLLYTGLFIPFSFMIDRFAHNRWQRRAEQQGQKQQPRRR